LNCINFEISAIDKNQIILNKKISLLLFLITSSLALFAQLDYSSLTSRYNYATSNSVENENTSPLSFNKSLDEEMEGFEGGLFAPNCWTLIDADGDGNNWFQYGADGTAYEGQFSAASASWFIVELTPDNYLVSPQLSLAENEQLGYYVASQDPYFLEEKYGVFLSTTGNNEEDFTTELLVETIYVEGWEERIIDLSAYSGMEIYIAFRHFDITDQLYIKIDNVTLPGTFTDCPAICLEVNNLSIEAITYTSATVMWNDIGSNYELVYGPLGFDPNTETPISLNTYSYELTDLLSATNYEVYVRNNCINDSTLSDWLSISFTTLIAIEGESFEGALFAPECWTLIDADGDGFNWYQDDEPESAYAGLYSAASDSYTDSALTPDNYLISPQLLLGSNEQLSYFVGTQDFFFYQENYGVYLSTTGNNESDFTIELFEETLFTDLWEERLIDLSAYNGMEVFIAFRHFAVSGESALKLDNIILPGNMINCVTALNEIDLNDFAIYPNPNNGRFNIIYKGVNGSFTIEMIDLTGRIVHREQLQINKGDLTKIDLDHYTPGVYLLKMTNSSDQYSTTVKMVIK